MKIIISETQIKKLLNLLNEDKMMNIGNGGLKLGGLDPMTQRYQVEISNISKKVIDFDSEFKPISQNEIQEMVDKLFRLDMITLVGNITDSTNVTIVIWEIDEDSGMYIETYHYSENDPDADLHDTGINGTMRYYDFLNA